MIAAPDALPTAPSAFSTQTERLAWELATIVEELRDALGLAESTVCARLTGDARTLEYIRQGRAFTTRLYDLAMSRAVAMWPPERPWPAGIPQVSVDAVRAAEKRRPAPRPRRRRFRAA